MRCKSLEPSHFEAIYSGHSDPWRYATSKYERRKYSATIEALGRRKFQSAFEIGCSIGILTRQLAYQCQSLLAVDVAEQALARAERNCKGLSHVNFDRMQVPKQWPSKAFDLIVLSEVLGYFCSSDICLTARQTVSSLSLEGTVLLVQCTGGGGYPTEGDQAIDLFRATCVDVLEVVLIRQEPEYRLELLVRRK
jgi:cyclopropane fatty-acyl-phospholipid synthase-like methyltransferase